MAPKLSRAGLLASSLLAAANAAEYHPSLPTWKCTSSGGCAQQNTSVVLDYVSKYASNAAGSRTASDYAAMGISTSGSAVTLQHYVNGNDATPRIYLTGADGDYVELDLLNQEIRVDVDYSATPCGENGAFYLSAMKASGTGGSESGGAEAGAGYCDAQCQGYCCAEMDILEANSKATAMTPHPCQGNSCDSSGCGLNPYSQGNHNLWAPGGTVDTSKTFTVVTAFAASGSTLTSITRTYIQNGKTTSGGTISSCNDGQGGLSGMGSSLSGGMVLVMSIWNSDSGMTWLDSGGNGPCSGSESSSSIQSSSPNTKVVFSNIRWGDIGSTTKS